MALTRTVLGPITSAWSAPSSCASIRLEEVNKSEDYWGNYGITCSAGSSGYPRDKAIEECWPPGVIESRSSIDRETMIFYSHATGCPAGFVPACTVTRKEGDSPPISSSNTYLAATFSIWHKLSAGELAVACCPSDYICDEMVYDQCISVATSGDVVRGTSYGSFCATEDVVFTVTDRTNTVGTATNFLLLTTGAVSGSIASSTRSGLSAGPTATSDSSSNASGSSESGGSSGSSGGLARGGKIAVGIVVPLFIIAAAAISTFFFRYLRKRENKPPTEETPQAFTGNVPPHGPPELEGGGGMGFAAIGRGNPEKSELDSTMVKEVNPELATNPISTAAELPTARPAQELPTTYASNQPNDPPPPSQPMSTSPSDFATNEPWKWNDPLYFGQPPPSTTTPHSTEGAVPVSPMVEDQSSAIEAARRETENLTTLQMEEARLEAELARHRELIKQSQQK